MLMSTTSRPGKRPREELALGGRVVRVENLQRPISEDRVRELLEEHGGRLAGEQALWMNEVRSVAVAEFETAEGAARAVQALSGFTFRGRALTAALSTSTLAEARDAEGAADESALDGAEAPPQRPVTGAAAESEETSNLRSGQPPAFLITETVPQLYWMPLPPARVRTARQQHKEILQRYTSTAQPPPAHPHSSGRPMLSARGRGRGAGRGSGSGPGLGRGRGRGRPVVNIIPNPSAAAAAAAAAASSPVAPASS